MQVITPGYRYRLNGFEKPDANTQVLQFYHKEPSEDDTKQLVTITDGTTNEEVIQVLIDRLKYLQEKIFCRENQNAINHLEYALQWMIERTTSRENRGVLGTNQK